jgi:hypothetical protein
LSRPGPSNPSTAVLSMKSADNLDRVREKAAQWMYDVLTSIDLDEKTLELQRKRTAPIQIASFEC